MWWLQDLKLVTWLLLVFLSLFSLFGCAALNPQPPVEAFANKLADEAIIPAVREGLTRGAQSLAIQAGAHGINPAYVVRFEGKWVTGLEGMASVGIEGFAGQMQVSSQSTGDKLTPPIPQKAVLQSSADDAASASPLEPGVAVYRLPSPAPQDVPETQPTTLTVTVLDIDRNENKGFSRLEDGTLVVIAGAADKLGQEVVIVPAGRRGGVLDATLASD